MIRIALSAFAFVFLAELGDKTQLAVLALTMKSPSPWPVLVGASLALILSTGLAVGLGFLANLPLAWGFSLISSSLLSLFDTSTTQLAGS